MLVAQLIPAQVMLSHAEHSQGSGAGGVEMHETLTQALCLQRRSCMRSRCSFESKAASGGTPA